MKLVMAKPRPVNFGATQRVEYEEELNARIE